MKERAMLNVAEIMTREPYTLSPDSTLQDARQAMAEHHIRHIPIVSDNGQLMGIVSHRDVLASGDSTLVPGTGTDGQKERYVALSSIMTTPVHTVEESASLRGTALHLQKYKLGCLAVVREHHLVGIITDSDFVAVAINLMEQLESIEPQEDNYDADEFDGENYLE
jgi:CBS domain-containing protein